MKKLIALLLILTLAITTVQLAWAGEESAGDSADAAVETADAGESESAEGESAEGESAEAPAETADAGESESAEGEAPAETADAGESESAEGESPEGEPDGAPAEAAAEPAAAGENRYEFSRFSSYDQVNEAIRIIPAEGDQVELGYLEGVTEILEADGLKFKDMNSNGVLDPYEDWRLPVDERVKDLYDQMDIYERSGLLFQIDTCNVPQGVDFADPKLMFGMDDELGIEIEAAPAAEEAAPAEGDSAESEGEPAAEAPAEGESAESEGEPAAEAPAEEAAPAEGDSGDSAAEAPAGEDAEAEEGESGDSSAAAAGMDMDSTWYLIQVLKITTQCDNTNGTPDQQVTYRNAIQALAEESRLGVPVCITTDREYNTWGGMIDSPHPAFGSANDLELAKTLWTEYARESRAVGIHITLHPYGQELGSWNGEDPYYAGMMTREEVNAIQIEDGIEATMKHFIARGGDSSFAEARSEGQTVDNWITAWRIALESNPKWIMTNGYNQGVTNTVHVDYDEATMKILREDLGYDGIVLSDWGSQSDSNSEGTTVDGITILDLSIPERYAWVINNGVDVLGSFGSDFDETGHEGATNRQAMIDALEQGLISEERCYEACFRVLKDKFELGLFENPYCDEAYALSLSASEAYIAERFDVIDTDSLTAARNPDVVELERKLEAESAILVKNDDNLLPLEKGIKVYLTSNTSLAMEGYQKVFPDFCTLVESIDEADVVIIDASEFNDTVEGTAEEAKDAGKKIVIVANGIEKDDNLTSAMSFSVENGDAVLLLTFKRQPDHGSSIAQYITTTEPIVFAQLLFGDVEPEGMVVKEIGRSTADNDIQWKDLSGDKGVDMYVRLMLLGTMESSENNVVPNNWGDPLLQYKYGMRYGAEPEFTYEALTLPKVQEEVTEEDSSGGTSTSVQTVKKATAGEPFTISFLMWNKGDDGMTTVQALVDGEVNAEKIMAINSGDWRVVQMELVIDEAGEHTIQVGDMTAVLNIGE